MENGCWFLDPGPQAFRSKNTLYIYSQKVQFKPTPTLSAHQLYTYGFLALLDMI